MSKELTQKEIDRLFLDSTEKAEEDYPHKSNFEVVYALLAIAFAIRGLWKDQQTTPQS